MFFAVTERISFELNQNRKKSNRVQKIKLQFNDYVLWSLYVLLLLFVSKALAKEPEEHQFKRTAGQFD